MRRLRRFLTLPATDRRLLVEAVLFLAAIRLGLRLLPFRTLWRLLDRAPRPSVAAGLFSPDRIAWAVSVTSPYVLGVRPCLPQALAAQLTWSVSTGHSRSGMWSRLLECRYTESSTAP